MFNIMHYLFHLFWYYITCCCIVYSLFNIFNIERNKELNWIELSYDSLADPGGRPPPNGREPMILLCPKRYFSPLFFSLASLAINGAIILLEIWLKHPKTTFTSTFNTFLTPLPVDKVHAPLRRKKVLCFH